MHPHGEITVLLRAWQAGDPGALDALAPLVYPVLHGLAAGQMNRERRNHTLQPTALVNEAFLRLTEAGQVEWQDRNHFLAISARMMRHVLVDHARSRDCSKRGGGVDRLPLDYANPADRMDVEELLAVNMALDVLARHDPRRAQVVELRFFGGLTVEETAGVMGLSPESVNRDWRVAKAWLLKHITESGTATGATSG